MRGGDQARQVPNRRFVFLLPQRSALHDPAFPNHVREGLVQLGDSRSGKAMRQPNDQLLPDPAKGVVNAVKSQDLPRRLLGRVDDPKKREIFLADKSKSVEMVGQKFLPCLPIVAMRRIHEHDWNNTRLPGLHQRERLEAFVHRSEAARKKCERMCLLHEVELASEEIVEVDQLRVAMNRFVGALLEG